MDWEFKVEFYTDEYKTLIQSLAISREEIEATNGLALTEARNKINPNLTKRCRVEYFDKNMKLIEVNCYDNNGYCYKTERR